MNGLLWEKEIRQAEHVRLLGRLDPQQPVFSMFFTGSGVPSLHHAGYGDRG